jgi:hypothetical protein
MNTDTLASPPDVDDVEIVHAADESKASRRQMRHERVASARRSRRRLAAAVVLCALVPTAFVLSLWSNLTEPFWFNEQWRAYYISNSANWWQALKTDGAPFPAGWYFLERISGELFGSTELSLRVPTAVFLPLTCVLLLLLARRWMPLVPAVAVAFVGSFTGCLFAYAIQLSEYQVDAAAVIAILLLHVMASEVFETADPGWRSPRVILAYAGITLACVFSTPAVFIAGPILLLDVGRAAWRRTVTLQAAAAVVSGSVILLQLLLFVLPQNALTKSGYWDTNFLPHHGFTKQLSFIWDGLTGFVTGPFSTSSSGPVSGLVTGLNFAWVLTLVYAVLLAVGVVVLARAERGRTVLFALICSLLVTAIASDQRYWPFGFVRTNYYEVPILIFVAGVGAVTAVTRSRALLRRLHESGRIRPAHLVAAWGACLIFVAGLATTVSFEVASYRQARASADAASYGKTIEVAVASVRAKSHPGTVVVVSGLMAIDGWNYYQFEYSGKSVETGWHLPAGDEVSTLDHGSKAITREVSSHQPRAVFYYFPWGTPPSDISRDIAAITAGEAGCQRTDAQNFAYSGMVVPFHCP